MNMKIEIKLNHPTLTENGRSIPAGVFMAEYDALRGLQFDSSDMERYDALRLNEIIIIRAIFDAEKSGSDVGTSERKNKSCAIRLIYAQ
jgi:hypothetical protein